MSRLEKLTTIRKILSKLYCFTSEEADQIISQANSCSEEGLEKLLTTLESGKKQQDEFLMRRVSEDKNYVKELSRFLKKSTDVMKATYEKSEHEGAEEILNNI